MDENDIIGLLTTQAIEIGQECLSINTAIDELFIAASNATLDRKAGFETALFQILSDRREELREELFRIDKEIKNFQAKIAADAAAGISRTVINLEDVEPGDLLLIENRGQVFGGRVWQSEAGGLWAGDTSIKNTNGLWILDPNLIHLHEKKAESG